MILFRAAPRLRPVAKRGRPFRDLPEFRVWLDIHAAADDAAGPMAEALERVLGGLLPGPLLDEIAARLEVGDVAGALALVPLGDLAAELREVWRDALARALTAAADATAAELGVAIGAAVAFGGPADPAALRWLEQRAAERVTGITDEMRQQAREIIAASFRAGRGGQGSARDLAHMLPLSARQTAALRRFRAELEERAFSAARIDELTNRYAKRLIRFRAQRIARTETGDAASEGQRRTWRAAVAGGDIPAAEWEREWVAVVPSDGRTCRVCQLLDGRRAPIGGFYTGSDGELIEGPTAHPLCRCVERLVRVGTPVAVLPESALTPPRYGRGLRPRSAA